jgi:hypothetical protein
MFEKLYKAIHSILPHKGFALFITLGSLGGATFLPYLADRMIDDYDELRYEYMIQRDRIKLLQMENDSLQDRLRAQSIEFSKLLYSATADFNKKIVELENKSNPILKKPDKIITYQTDKPIPTIRRWRINKNLIDSSEIENDINNIKTISVLPSHTPTPTSVKIDTSSSNVVKKKPHTTKNILDIFKHKKAKPVFNPDKKK